MVSLDQSCPASLGKDETMAFASEGVLVPCATGLVGFLVTVMAGRTDLALPRTVIALSLSFSVAASLIYAHVAAFQRMIAYKECLEVSDEELLLLLGGSTAKTIWQPGSDKTSRIHVATVSDDDSDGDEMSSGQNPVQVSESSSSHFRATFADICTKLGAHGGVSGTVIHGISTFVNMIKSAGGQYSRTSEATPPVEVLEQALETLQELSPSPETDERLVCEPENSFTTEITQDPLASTLPSEPVERANDPMRTPPRGSNEDKAPEQLSRLEELRRKRAEKETALRQGFGRLGTKEGQLPGASAEEESVHEGGEARRDASGSPARGQPLGRPPLAPPARTGLKQEVLSENRAKTAPAEETSPTTSIHYPNGDFDVAAIPDITSTPGGDTFLTEGGDSDEVNPLDGSSDEIPDLPLTPALDHGHAGSAAESIPRRVFLPDTLSCCDSKMVDPPVLPNNVVDHRSECTESRNRGVTLNLRVQSSEAPLRLSSRQYLDVAKRSAPLKASEIADPTDGKPAAALESASRSSKASSKHGGFASTLTKATNAMTPQNLGGAICMLLNMYGMFFRRSFELKRSFFDLWKGICALQQKRRIMARGEDTKEAAADLLRNTCWFENASDPLVDAIAEKMFPVRVEHGHVFCQEGRPLQHMIFLEKGSLTRTRLGVYDDGSNGKKKAIQNMSQVARAALGVNTVTVDTLHGRGRVVGMRHCVEEQATANFTTVSALSKAKVWLLSAEDFRYVVKSSGAFSYEIMAAMMRELKSSDTALRAISRGTGTNPQPCDATCDGQVLRVLCYDATPVVSVGFQAAVAAFNQGQEAGGLCIRMDFTLERLGVRSASLAAGYDAICTFVNDHVDSRVLQTLSLLGVKMIAQRSASYDRIDTKAASAYGITVARAPVFSPHAVADMAISLYMSVNRKLVANSASNRIQMSNFTQGEGLMGMNLHGKIVGILGTRNTGRILSNIVLGFGARLLCHDFLAVEQVVAAGGTYVSKEDLLAQADVIFVTMPLLPQTRNLINKSTIGRMKEGVILINTSRPGVVDTKAMLCGLRTGRIAGAGIDLYESEQCGSTRDSKSVAALAGHGNVVVADHQAFCTKEAAGQIINITIENLRVYHDGLTGASHPNSCVPAILKK